MRLAERRLPAIRGNFLLVGRRHVDVWPEVRPVAVMSTYGILKEDWRAWKLYGPGLEVRELREVTTRPLGKIRRMLARTVYNPRLVVRLTWDAPRVVSLDDTKLHFLAALGEEDDLLTQFYRAEEIRLWIEAAATYGVLLEVARRALGAYEGSVE